MELGNQKIQTDEKKILKAKVISITAKKQVVISRSSGKVTNISHSIMLEEKTHLKGIIKLQ